VFVVSLGRAVVKAQCLLDPFGFRNSDSAAGPDWIPAAGDSPPDERQDDLPGGRWQQVLERDEGVADAELAVALEDQVAEAVMQRENACANGRAIGADPGRYRLLPGGCGSRLTKATASSTSIRV